MRATFSIVPLVLCTLLGLSACKKKGADATAGAAGTQAPAPAANGVQSTPDEAAAKLGFVGYLPADTEAFFNVLNLPKHAQALKSSNWAKDVDAFINDKTPAPAAGSSAIPDASAALQQLWGKDFFVAVGKGGSASLKTWQSLMSLNTEIQYMTLMRGSVGGEAKPKAAGDVPMLSTVLESPTLRKRALEMVKGLTLPPLMIGVRTDKPDDVLKQLLPAKLLQQMKEKAKVSQMTAKGASFTLVEGTFASILTDDIAKGFTPPADQGEAAADVTALIKAIQQKPFCLAYGSTAGHLIVALGEGRPNLQFAATPAESVLARPELRFVLPYSALNLAVVGYAEADLLQSLQNPEPMQPIARGILEGLKSSPMFAGMAKTLEPRIQELGKLEHDLQSRKFATAAGVAWWDKGLHVELKGGQSPEGLDGKKPLRFAPLVDDASVLMGVAYHGDPELTGKMRKMVEAWSVILRDAAQELVKAGLGGKDGPAIAKWVESDILPHVATFYDGSKEVFQKGVGNEHAWVIDLGGKMPQLPFFPQGSAGSTQKMLRIAAIDDVINRPSIGSGWTPMQQSLNKIAGAFPMFAGQALPEPVPSNQPGGLNTYSYQLLPGTDDLVPCASVSDTLLMMGTSMTQHGELATRLLRAKPSTENSTARWRLNFPAIREAVKTFSTNGGAPTNADTMKSTIKWMAPLGEASGRMWIEAGNVRNSVTIEVNDVEHFD